MDAANSSTSNSDGATMNECNLPVEREEGCSPSFALAPILFSVGCVLILNLGLVLAGVRHPVRHEQNLLSAKWSLATSATQDFDWIVVGDSSASLGIDPSILSKELKSKTINLASFGSMGLTGDLWMLDEYLQNHEPPRGVIVVHAAEVWGGGQGDAFYQYAAAIPVSTLSLVTRLISWHSSPSEIYHCLNHRNWFPLTLLKDQARFLLGWSTQPIATTRGTLELPPDGLMRMDSSRANIDHVKEHARTYWEAFGDSIPQFGPGAEAIAALVQRSDRFGFDLYFANGPVPDCLAESEDFHDRTCVIRKELEQIADDHDNVHYLLRDWVRFSPAEMENANHVVGPAVDRYTAELASAITAEQPRVPGK